MRLHFFFVPFFCVFHVVGSLVAVAGALVVVFLMYLRCYTNKSRFIHVDELAIAYGIALRFIFISVYFFLLVRTKALSWLCSLSISERIENVDDRNEHARSGRGREGGSEKISGESAKENIQANKYISNPLHRLAAL